MAQKKLEEEKTLSSNEKENNDSSSFQVNVPNMHEKRIEEVKKLNAQNKYVEAHALIISVMKECKSNHHECINSRGVCLRKLERFQEALTDFNKAIELYQNDSEYFHNRGLTFYHMKEYEKCLVDYNKSIEMNGNRATYYKVLGDCLDEMKRYNKAIESYTKALEIEKKCETYNNRGLVFDKLDQPKKALLDFTEALKIDGKKPSIINNKGTCYLDLNQFNKARDEFLKGLKIIETEFKGVHRDHHSLHYNLAICYRDTKQLNKSIESYSKSLNLKEDADAYKGRGSVYKELKKTDLALKDFDKALLLDVKRVDVYLEKARIFEEKKEFNKAIRELTKSIKYEKNKTNLSSRADIYFQQKKYQKSINDYTLAIKIFLEKSGTKGIKKKSISSFYFNRSLSYTYLKEGKKSIEDLNKAISIVEKPEYVRRRAISYVMIGEYEKAIGDFRRAMEKGYKYKCDLYFQIGTILYFQKKYVEAILAFSNSIKDEKDFEMAYYGRALAEIQLNIFNDAVEDLEFVSKVDDCFGLHFDKKFITFFIKRSLSMLKRKSKEKGNKKNFELIHFLQKKYKDIERVVFLFMKENFIEKYYNKLIQKWKPFLNIKQITKISKFSNITIFVQN